MIIPIIGAFSLSFYDWDILTLPSFVGLSNFIKLVGDPTFLAALKNTMVFILGYTPLVMVSGLLCALILNMKIPARTFLRAAFFLPVVSSWVAVALLWQWLFNSEVGLINYGLSLLGIQGPAWLYSETWAMPAIIITSVWKDTGFVMMIFLGGLQGISRTYYEAARIDGATKVHTFWFITRPLLSPTTFFILVVTLINSFQVFEQVYVMTGGGPAGSTSVLVQQIYLNTARYSRMGYASSMALVLFALIMSVTVVQMILQKRWVHYDV
jgi:multiple sugar transport system permease protein